MNISTVNELVASLESAGELSIKETNVMALAKAYLDVTAENLAIREQSEEVYAAGYNHGHLNTVDGIAYAGCVKDDFYSLALQVMADVETPATDRIVAGIKADGVEEFSADLGAVYQQLRQGSAQAKTVKSVIFRAAAFSAALREGADK